MQFLALLLLLQISPTSDSADNDTAILAGRVTNSQTGEAISGATVQARGVVMTSHSGDSAKEAKTTTQADGSFRFDRLTPGTYFLDTTAPSFVHNLYGMRGRGTGPAFVQLRGGQSQNDITVQLTPQATVSGKVTDAEGKGLAHLQVEAFSRNAPGTRRGNFAQSAAQTNGEGEFRLTNLPAGQYVIAAQQRTAVNRRTPEKKPASPDLEPPVELIRTYFPSASDASTAQAISLSEGQDQGDTVIRMRQAPTYHVRGRVEMTELASTRVSLVLAPADNVDTSSSYRATVSPDGSFDIAHIPAGTYALRLLGQRAGQAGRRHLLVQNSIEVSSNDVRDVALAPGPAIEMTGQVTVEENVQADLSHIFLSLISLDEADVSSFVRGTVDASGKFNINDLDPVHYRLNAMSLPAGTYVKSVSLNGANTSGANLDLTNGGNGQLQIVLRPGAAQVDATVADDGTASITTAASNGAYTNPQLSVMLVPDEPSTEGSGPYYGRRTGNNSFSVTGVPPGKYHAFALYQPAFGDWQNPSFVQQMQSQGTAVELEENARKQMQLNMISAGAAQQAAAELGLSN